jgi:hypothetical protein
LVAIGSEFFATPSVEKFELFLSQIDELVNKPLADISERYKNKVPTVWLPGGAGVEAVDLSG